MYEIKERLVFQPLLPFVSRKVLDNARSLCYDEKDEKRGGVYRMFTIECFSIFERAQDPMLKDAADAKRYIKKQLCEVYCELVSKGAGIGMNAEDCRYQISEDGMKGEMRCGKTKVFLAEAYEVKPIQLEDGEPMLVKIVGKNQTKWETRMLDPDNPLSVTNKKSSFGDLLYLYDLEQVVKKIDDCI